MKILILINEFPPGPGGVGTHGYELARHLKRTGHSVEVVCAQGYSSLEVITAFNKALEFSIHPYPHTLSYVSRLRLVYQVMRDQRPDIVIASGSNSVWIAALYKLFFRFYKLVVVAHGGELTFSSPIRRGLTHWGCRVADHIISVSAYTKLYIPSGQESKITVIGNGANHFLLKALNRKEELKATHGFSGKKILLTVGSVSERKGQDIVIRALKNVLKHNPDVVYLMAGRSNKLEYFKGIAQKAGVESQVRFLGSVSADYLLELYNMADVYVISSRHSSDGDFEGFGISVIEAALCGVPAVVTSDSGLVEAIDEGITGISVPPENAEALAGAIVQLLDDRIRIPMGAAAKKRAEESFTWEKVVELYDLVLKKLV
jgi:phosphatidyl-myo-inositol dimannoside synthase